MMNSNICLPPLTLCYDRNVWLHYGIKEPIAINLDKFCHILIVGSSGSGKSMASLLLTARISLHIPTSKIWILDFKGDGDTFGFLDGNSACRYWRFTSCKAGLENYYAMFQERLSNSPGPDAGLCLLWVDELSSFLLNLPKKDADIAKSMLSTILMMGRSKRCQIITTVQRASAELFSQGARDNYGICLSMGNITKESSATLGFDREAFFPVTSIGGGHLLLNGTDQRPIQVPYIGPSGMEKVKAAILQAVTR